MRVPKGVVGIIGPWNYPLYLDDRRGAIPALLAGNGVVIARRTRQTALTVLWAPKLAEQAGLPSGLLQVVAGPGQRGSAPR